MAYNRTYYFDFMSESNLKYRVEMYDQIASSAHYDKKGTLGGGAVSIKYGSDGASMFAPLKPSTLTLDFMVTDISTASYINELRTSRNERDVYISMYRESVSGTNNPQFAPMWGGYLLMDLSDEPDDAVPYSIKLKAIDGLASLKYFDFVPQTTTQNPEGLYDVGDTFIPDPNNSGGQYDTWRTFIDLISICMSYSGHYTTSTGSPGNPQIVTAVRWYNGKHPNTTDDPLLKTRTKPINLYEAQTQDDDTLKYKAKTCYDVLKGICKAWGMRAVYWKNRWYFIQINQFRKTESGTNLDPININTHTYSIAGAALSTADDIDTYWSKYFIPLSSAGGSSIRNYKITGGQYGILPAIKKVTVDFLSVDNINYFTQFPPIPGYGNPAHNTDKWLHSILGTFTFDGVNDQDFYQRIVLTMSNPTTNTGEMEFFWGLFARPAGTGSNVATNSPHDNGFDYQLYPNYNTSPGQPPLEWRGYSNWWADPGQFPGTGPGYYYGQLWIPIPISVGTHTVDILDNVNSTVASAAYSYPHCPASVFTAGDWEFAYYVRNYNSSDTNIYEHGKVSLGLGSGSDNDPSGYNINYVNAPTGQGINSSVFSPIINGAIGNVALNTTTVQSTTDTESITITDVYFGDTGSLSSGGSIQVYDGTDWELTEMGGDWGIDTLVGDNSFSAQLIEDILNTQGKITKTFSVQTTLDPTLGPFYNDGTANRPMFACPFTKFFTPTHSASGTAGANWIMNTATWFPIKDIWKWNLYEQKNYAISGTTSTTGTAGVYTGTYGGAGVPIPDADIDVSIAPPPTGNLGPSQAQQLRLLNTQKIASITAVKTKQTITATSAPFEQTITYLDVQEIATAIFKTGDVFSLQTKSQSWTNTPYAPLSFEVSADQPAGATRISVVSQDITRDILVGDTISFDVKDIISQYQSKTKGTIGGMTITSDSIDGAKSVGREQVFLRGDGNGLSEGNYYVLNGEDNTRSGRFSPENTNAPATISTQRAIKSGIFICDADYTIESGTSIITGTNGWDMEVHLYKTTPVDGTTGATDMTLIGKFDVSLALDSRTQIDSLTSISSEIISKGDIIIPHIYAPISGGTTFNFRGGITFTLIRKS